ncbi:MAG: hypothetical protein WCH31_03385 [Actinomycetes bacterium]
MTPPRRRTLFDRIFGSIQLLGAGLVIVVFYVVEAHLRTTVWLFTDELEWSQLSRAIATTGQAARRGTPIYFQSVYAYLIAPAWWIHSTASAYALIKVINTVVMCTAAIPAYLLARMLVSRRASLITASLTVAIPPMSYATSIVPEPLAYPWFALTALLAIRALASPTRRSIAIAVACSLAGIFVREQFIILPAILSLAAAGLWIVHADPGTHGHGPRLRRAGLTASLIVAAVLLFDRVGIIGYQGNLERYINGHTFRYGVLALGAHAIGLGLLPLIGGFVSTWLPERRPDPVYRAFVAYLMASFAVLVTYTAGKTTALAGVYLALIEERNLFYLAPLLLVGSALVAGARRLDWRVVGLATGAVLYITWSEEFIQGVPYFEAPGLGILTIANRSFRWDIKDIHLLLGGAAAASLLLLALRRRRGVPLLAAVAVCAWMLAGQIEETIGNDSLANRVVHYLPDQRDWVDQATGGSKVTYLGQLMFNDNELWLTEFWNRSVSHVASLDGTAPGPGPVSGPGVIGTDGELSHPTGDPYVLAGNGVHLEAELVASRNGLNLYRLDGSWRLRDELQQVFADGWAPDWCTYTFFAKRGPGTVVIHLSRAGYRGNAPPGHVTLTVGTVRLDSHQAPQIARLLATRRSLIRNGVAKVIRVHVEQTPVRVVIRITPTFRAAGSDIRQLGAQVGFRYVPDSPAP